MRLNSPPDHLSFWWFQSLPLYISRTSAKPPTAPVEICGLATMEFREPRAKCTAREFT
jgi:hypothetical protein